MAKRREWCGNLSDRMSNLFEVLNMTEEARAKRKLLSDELKQLRFINGRLFDDRLPPADFSAKMRKLLLECRCFDWSSISPAIFGAMFQGVMKKDLRRELGAHYTDLDNILKLLNPLFLDDLWQEFEHVKATPTALDKFHDKIASLKFLDPACGCGNFLMLAYRELRLLELEILKMKVSTSQKRLDISLLLKVNVEQFYGIEVEYFPCQVAMVGMWLTDHQMNIKVSEQFGQYYARRPLMQCTTIVHGNALRIDWEDVVPKEELSYILGNPPYNGARTMTSRQKEEMLDIFSRYRGPGGLDYVTCWLKKALDYIKETKIEVAFVSTNSITQGEQAEILWRHLFADGIVINFAHQTFKWWNEAKGKAQVYCVIIGFAMFERSVKKLFRYATPTSKPKITKVQFINQYLADAPGILVESRSKPLCDVPKMVFGSMPNDGGHLLLTPKERKQLVQNDSAIKDFIRPFMGAEEFINGTKRYCIWLHGVSPSLYRHNKDVLSRIAKVRNHRQNSKRETTKRLAERPAEFGEIRQPNSNYLIIPSVSTSGRRYIPMGFAEKNTICSNLNLMVPNASFFELGVLTSRIHMVWIKYVCGRLGNAYRYSAKIVYNNFPWPDVTDNQKTTIETLAKTVLETRAKFSDSSLADLYDPLTMPPELLKSHRNLDNAVMKLYGFKKDTSEPAVLAALMEMYQKLTAPPTLIPEPPKEKTRKR